MFNASDLIEMMEARAKRECPKPKIPIADATHHDVRVIQTKAIEE